jgi:alpha-D-xyloside xylohydrolase
MKFSDGYWQTREGIRVQNPVHIRDVQIDENTLNVYVACRRIERKGDTLNGTLLTIRFHSPRPDVIGIQLVHHEGRQNVGPEFPLLPSEGHTTHITNDEEQATLTSGGLSVVVRKKGAWKVDFFYDGKRITGSGPKGLAYITTDKKESFVREQLDLGVGEYVYGLGERFTPFVKNGQVVDIWNEDGGTSSEQAYKNIPFYMSNRGYGVFVNHPERVSFEVASEVVSKVQFSVAGEDLNYYIIGGTTPKDVLSNFTDLTGKPALPPAWSFGLWLTTSFTTSYDEATVNSFIDGMSERELPLHVFHFDCFWMKEYQWCDFEWDKDVFPDPEGMLQRLKEKGLKICVWINPYIAQKSPLFAEGAKHGYLVRTAEGHVWQWDMWQAGMGLVDFTNPAAVEWFQGKLRRLLDMGVDCFKTDFGERIPTNVVYFDGSDPYKMHNFYTYLYNKAVFDLLVEARGENEAALFARSATAACQMFPVHWGGDCSANYDSMAESLRGGLSLSLSGFGFWSHDISGFESTATPDLYKRWVAFGLLSSHSRLHGGQSYRVPWLFDEEAVDVLRFFTNWKCRLMPYLFAAANDAHTLGIPMMRPMMLEFPDDPACDHLDRQYMLGDSLLVAPIFNDEADVRYYVPEGSWTHFFSGETVEGGRWHKENHDYFSLPLLAKPNSIITIGNNDQIPDYDYSSGVVLHLFELEDARSTLASVVSAKGERELEVQVIREGNTMTIRQQQYTSNKSWSLLLRGIEKIQSVTGGTWESDSLGARIIPTEGAKEIVLSLFTVE